jgi:hypothetical protein
VLDDVGYGEVSNVIAALSYILDLNNSGRSELKIHGVNISLGYEFEPEWFACGESPICMEVNRVDDPACQWSWRPGIPATAL